MNRFARWFQYARSLMLAFRVVAFEKPLFAAAVVWVPMAVLTVLAALAFSVTAGLIAFAAVLALFFWLKQWSARNLYRLIRPADRIEFAVMDDAGDGYRQRFEQGFVVRAMRKEDARRSGAFNDDIIEANDHFFLVRTREKNKIIAFEWITGIEIGNDDMLT